MKDLDHNQCSVAKTLKVVGSRWTLLILHNIFEGRNRFGQLQRSLTGISPKTLATRLQELEKEGIIRRKVFAEIPLRVEYSLTEKGKSLSKIFKEMERWGDQA